VEREQKEAEACGSRRGAGEAIVLEHHVVEVFIVGDGDESVEVLAGELVLEEGGIGGGVGEGGESGEEGGELDVAVYGEDLGVAGDVGEVVVVGARLDSAAVAAHELDLGMEGGRGLVEGVVVVVVVGVGVAGAWGGVAGIHGARVWEIGRERRIEFGEWEWLVCECVLLRKRVMENGVTIKKRRREEFEFYGVDGDGGGVG